MTLAIETSTGIYSILFGIVIALVANILSRTFLGAFVDSLLSRKATSPDKALSFEELKVKETLILKLSLRCNKTLRRMIKRENDRWYAEEKYAEKLRNMYGREKFSLLSLILTLIMFAAVILIVNYVLPLINL